jgi:HK97 family phage prohead protease
MDEQRTIVREGLQRTMPFTLERATDDGEPSDGLTLEGHAAVFNTPALIDSWEGRFYEQIAKGAFKKTFAERTPVLQFDHGHHPLIGSIPIGRINTAKEDTEGAYVKGRLHDNWLIQPVRDAIREESITGMSFRFTVVRDEWRDEKGRLINDPNKLLEMMWGGDEIPTRTLREIKVPELGPVVFPAYEATDVGVRSGRTVIDLSRLRQDPDARKQLGRALWMAEQGPADGVAGGELPAGTVTRDAIGTDAPVTPMTVTFNVTLDGSRSVEDVGRDLTVALARAAGAGQNQISHNDDVPSGPPAADNGHRPDDTEPPGTDGAHRSTDTAPAGDGHADPAPASERHAGDDDEPPEGHSSPAPNWASDRRARKAHMAYVREMAKNAADRRAVYERTVTRWEAEQLASQDPTGDDQSATNHEGNQD